MKNYLILLVALVSFSGYSQISFGAKHIGKKQVEFTSGLLETFKNSKTIFILPEKANKQTYESILKETWEVTPYQILTLEEFQDFDVLQDNYSFANPELKILIRSGKNGIKNHIMKFSFDFYILSKDEIEKKLGKVKTKNRGKKFKELFKKHRSTMVKIPLHPHKDLVEKLYPGNQFYPVVRELESKKAEIVDFMYTENPMFNFKPGFIKNYLQKVNQLVSDGGIYSMYNEDSNHDELKNLKQKTLIVPKYAVSKVDFANFRDAMNKKTSYVDISKKVFKSYDYQYEITSVDEISNKIVKGEQFYYVRYVAVNAEKFLQIVNSKTGEIIYRDYIAGTNLSPNLKSKHIETLNKAIKKSTKKKLAK